MLLSFINNDLSMTYILKKYFYYDFLKKKKKIMFLNGNK